MLSITQAPAQPTDLDAKACRRLVTAVLLSACLDASDGDGTAWQWICGPEAAHLADLVDFDHLWPPAPAQLGIQRELEARARALAAGLQPAAGRKEAQLHLFRAQW